MEECIRYCWRMTNRLSVWPWPDGFESVWRQSEDPSGSGRERGGEAVL